MKFPYKVSATSTGAASPSVTLEKGSYRIRAPSNRPPRFSRSQPPVVRPVPTQTNTGFLLALVVILAFACLTCFGVAYYLFTTRCAAVAIRGPRNPTDSRAQVVPFNPTSHRSDPHEKFLAYLPHSGFHNQRIAFENALTLARLINRTLIVPPIRLGNKPIHYVTFDSLQRLIAMSGKDGLSHCAEVPTLGMSLPPECFDYYDYTLISWDWLVNLTEVTSNQPLFFQWNMSQAWISDHLSISQSDILIFNDSNAYHFRFLDTLSDASPRTDRYKEDVYIPHLMACSHRVIQMGTMFGTSRLRLKNDTNLEIRRAIRRSMIFANPILKNITCSIVQSLSSPYLGAHVRLGDGRFKAREDEIASEIWWKLVHGVLSFSPDETLDLWRVATTNKSSGPFPSQPSTHSGRSYPPPSPFAPGPSSLRCRSHLHTDAHLQILNMPLYISTDIRDPASSPSLKIFRQTFPCTFFLGDFANEVMVLDNLVNDYDDVYLKPHLLPFIDAIIVARAYSVVGTDGSTFSDFVKNVLWTGYHGLDIVDRG